MGKDAKKDSHHRLVYSSDRRFLINELKAKGLTREQVVLAITRNETYEGCLAIAREWAPVLSMKVSEFMVLARRRKS